MLSPVEVCPFLAVSSPLQASFCPPLEAETAKREKWVIRMATSFYSSVTYFFSVAEPEPEP